MKNHKLLLIDHFKKISSKLRAFNNKLLKALIKIKFPGDYVK